MTQRDLGLIWAVNGGATNPGSIKYENGWVAEIPTYQNFNYSIQTLDMNLTHLAGNVAFTWDSNIQYEPGARCVGSNGQNYTCVASSLGDNPTADVNGSHWVQAFIVGIYYSEARQGEFFRVDGNPRGNASWSTMDVVVENRFPMIELRDDATTGNEAKNFAIGNMTGELCFLDLGTSTPDGRDLNDDQYKKRIFHEGHLPTVDEVVGGVGEAPNDGALYARKGIDSESGEWIRVTSTAVAETPPNATIGNGAGWYNLTDGQLYLDIDDGDSSQWVPASPTYIPNRKQFLVLTNNAVSNMPSGWTASWAGSVLTITHNEGKLIHPTLTCRSTSAFTASVLGASSNSFQVRTYDSSGSAVPCDVIISVDY